VLNGHMRLTGSPARPNNIRFYERQRTIADKKETDLRVSKPRSVAMIGATR